MDDDTKQDLWRGKKCHGYKIVEINAIELLKERRNVMVAKPDATVQIHSFPFEGSRNVMGAKPDAMGLFAGI